MRSASDQGVVGRRGVSEAGEIIVSEEECLRLGQDEEARDRQLIAQRSNGEDGEIFVAQSHTESLASELFLADADVPTGRTEPDVEGLSVRLDGGDDHHRPLEVTHEEHADFARHARWGVGIALDERPLDLCPCARLPSERALQPAKCVLQRLSQRNSHDVVPPFFLYRMKNAKTRTQRQKCLWVLVG